jgi:hypothetical protein
MAIGPGKYDEAREAIPMGLVRIPRQPHDEYQIVETWA